MHIRPLADRVVIKRTPGEKMIGRIHMPDSVVKAHSTQGTVLALGPRVKRPIRLGDVVTFKSWEANDVRLNGEPVVIVFEEAIDGVWDA